MKYIFTEMVFWTLLIAAILILVGRWMHPALFSQGLALIVFTLVAFSALTLLGQKKHDQL